MIYNWKIIGHEKQLSALENDITSGNLAHAYLFSGPEQVGKFTAAKNMAHILQCPNDFCHTCQVCQHIEKGYHAETIEMRDNGESVKIEDIRNVLEKLSMTTQGRHLVLLLENVERLTPEAANCLLKTLEEPHPGTVFLLTTAVIHELPETILSRVRVVSFHFSPESVILKALRERYADATPETLKEATSFALGKAGKALQFLQKPEVLESHRHMYHELLRFFRASSYAERFSFLGEILEDDLKIHDFLDILLHVVRQELLQDTASSRRKIELIELATEGRQLLKKNVNKRLVLENLLIQF